VTRRAATFSDFRAVVLLNHRASHGKAPSAAGAETRRAPSGRTLSAVAADSHRAQPLEPLQASEEAKDDLKDDHGGGCPEQVDAHRLVASRPDVFDGLDQ